ncbi:GNAT family N-acetyltransferase [Ralstonia solanacearum]|uniref:GNAT family N-acetyltransferase n=1 Tax=Ralstonia solanacearum TaxID=305 RepID=UPI001FF86E12|nr:GNAT family N-acetyltransferase [Ralstonia solanacearum]MDB0529742.1 GNAT family N-acetyltransferase [Ralstonia solanacearum]
MKISLESPAQPEIVRLIDALDAYQKPLYPAESHHGIDLESLMQDNVLFAVARDDDGEAVACGAIVVDATRGELKRFYTDPSQRGKGVAKSLLNFLEDAARKGGCREFVLETGCLQPEAISFYSACGYEYCKPFGNYVDDPNSVFMQKIDG